MTPPAPIFAATVRPPVNPTLVIAEAAPTPNAPAAPHIKACLKLISLKL